MDSAIIVAIDSAGRLVIPKRVRAQAGFKPGMPLVIRCTGGVVELKVAPVEVKLRSKGKVTIIEPEDRIEDELTAEVVAETLDAVRDGAR